MSMTTLPIKSYAVCSEDEDVITADDESSFEQAEELLSKMRDKEPNKVWELIAVFDA